MTDDEKEGGRRWIWRIATGVFWGNMLTAVVALTLLYISGCTARQEAEQETVRIEAAADRLANQMDAAAANVR